MLFLFSAMQTSLNWLCKSAAVILSLELSLRLLLFAHAASRSSIFLAIYSLGFGGTAEALGDIRTISQQTLTVHTSIQHLKRLVTQLAILVVLFRFGEAESTECSI